MSEKGLRLEMSKLHMSILGSKRKNCNLHAGNAG